MSFTSQCGSVIIMLTATCNGIRGSAPLIDCLLCPSLSANSRGRLQLVEMLGASAERRGRRDHPLCYK